MLHRNRPYRRAWRKSVVAALLVALFINLIQSTAALAWKPTTHVFLGDIALKDALDNGKVTIHRVNYRTGQILGVLGEYAVEPTILAALQNYAPQYHAGILGPDAYPDILTGQQVIHPGMEHTGIDNGTDAWLSYLWNQSLLPQHQTGAIKAFTVGYLTHAAGDMFGHTFINNFTGGEFELGINAVKHIVLEGYIDKRLDKNALDANFFQASIAGVDGYIYQNLVDARPGTILNERLLRDGGGGTDYSIPRIFSTLRAELVTEIAEDRAAADDCSLIDPRCSATILNLIADYKVAWVNDIDAGLRAWPQTSHQIAVALFFNEQRKGDTDTAFALAQDYILRHYISMQGAPDFVGSGLIAIGDIIAAVTPNFLKDEIAALKAALLDTLLQEAFGVTKEQIKEYLTNPDKYFNLVMDGGAGEDVTLARMNAQYLHLTDPAYTNPNEAFDYTKVPALYNTATMSKLIMLSRTEINRLLSDLGSSVRLDAANIMLGFIPSLDGSTQWLDGMVFARDSETYRQIFMLQPGETALNGRPIANRDSGYNTNANAVLTVPAPGLLANDIDPDGDALTAIRAGGFYEPQNGALQLNPDGSFVYTPFGNEVDDAFGYYVSDGNRDSQVTWVAITVNPANDPPVARDDGQYQAYENESFTLYQTDGLLWNDYDRDGDLLTPQIVTNPSHGTVTLNDDNSFIYIPATDYNGDDAFTYKVSDGQVDSNVATVSLNVFPDFNWVMANDEGYVTLKNQPLVVPAPGLLGNDEDRDGLPLTAHFDGGRLRGEITLNLDGSFVYTPELDFVGSTGFVYFASDGLIDSNQSATQIIVREENAIPVAGDDAFTFDGGSDLTVDTPGVLANDWDGDYHPEYESKGNSPTDPLSAQLVTGPDHGALTLNPDGSFSYSPDGSFSGRDSFTYQTSDSHVDSNVATVWIGDSAVNSAPVAAGDSYSTFVDAELVVAAPGLLTNDSDADNDPLSLLPAAPPTHGFLKLNVDGSFVYSPTAGYNGTDGFTYTLFDALGMTTTAQVDLTVGTQSVPNQQPVAVNDLFTTTQGVTVTLALTANDSDPDGDTLTVIILTQPTNGTATVNNGQVGYAPNAGFSGDDSFTYRVSDGKGGAAIATVTVTVIDPTVVNQPPSATNDTVETTTGGPITINVTANDRDADGDTLTVTILTPPSNGTATVSSGQILYTPKAGFSGTDSFTYRISDGKGGNATATVTVTVSGGGSAEQRIYLPMINR
jgi:hypothetical protein